MISAVLNISVYKSLSQLISQLHGLVERVQRQAPIEEIDLHIAAVRSTLTAVQETIDTGLTGVGSLSQHLGWLRLGYQRNKPNEYKSDLNDLQGQDLAEVIHAVDSWAQTLLDRRLRDAIHRSWQSRQYENAVRDSFICLEEALRAAGQIDHSVGLSGDRLVSAVFSSDGPYMKSFPSDGFMGNLTTGEWTGLQHLVRGALLLFRNATSHRSIQHSANEAENIIQLVNLCLRFLPPKAD